MTRVHPPTPTGDGPIRDGAGSGGTSRLVRRAQLRSPAGPWEPISAAGLVAGLVVALLVESTFGVSLGLALALTAVSHRSVPLAAAAAFVAAVVAVSGADIGLAEVARGTAGVGLVVSATLLTPAESGPRATRIAVCALALVAATLAVPGANGWFRLAAATLVAVDALTLLWRNDFGRLAGLAATSTAVAIGWLVLADDIDWPTPRWDSDAPAWLIALDGGCLVLALALVARAFRERDRDRLTPWLAPAVLAAVGLAQIDSTVTGIWIGVLIAVVVVDAGW